MKRRAHRLLNAMRNCELAAQVKRVADSAHSDGRAAAARGDAAVAAEYFAEATSLDKYSRWLATRSSFRP